MGLETWDGEEEEGEEGDDILSFGEVLSFLSSLGLRGDRGSWERSGSLQLDTGAMSFLESEFLLGLSGMRGSSLLITLSTLVGTLMERMHKTMLTLCYPHIRGSRS